MEKADLKTGMRIEVRENYLTAIVLKDESRFIAITKCGNYHNLNDYNDDLTQAIHESLDIVSVISEPSRISQLFDFNKRGAIIWERKEEKPILELDGVEYSEETLRSLIKKATQ